MLKQLQARRGEGVRRQGVTDKRKKKIEEKIEAVKYK